MRERGVNGVMKHRTGAGQQASGETIRSRVCLSPKLALLLGTFFALTAEQLVWVQPAYAAPQPLRVVVNSDQDTIQADDGITLREAIALVNGTLSADRLSASERSQVSSGDRPQINFSLPEGRTTIRLNNVLPDLAAPGLTIDGTTQTGYSEQRIINEAPITVPVVSLTPAAGKQSSVG
jgi:hypothetical protein